MTTGRSQFVGIAGEYYVAYCLAVRNLHASITIGNAPNIDILVSSSDGTKQIAIQVKTSRNAYRPKKHGHQIWEWDVGFSAINRKGENLWYAFVDLQESANGWSPQVFLVPSLWVSNYVKPEHSRKMYLLMGTAKHLTHERWDLIEKYLQGQKEAIDWATTYPEEAKWPYA